MGQRKSHLHAKSKGEKTKTITRNLKRVPLRQEPFLNVAEEGWIEDPIARLAYRL
jgi:hypothetical protein